MPKPGVILQPNTYRSLQQGINQLLNAVGPTLGPYPRLVAYDNQVDGLELLDDGGLIARRIIQLPNRDADMGAMYVRQLLWQLRQSAGDGAATAAVIFQTVFNEGVRFVAADGNPMLLRRHLEAGLQLILAELERQTFPVEGREKLAGLAESICHEPELAKLLGQIFDIIGGFGCLEIRSGRSQESWLEYVDDMYWPGGVFSPVQMTDSGQRRIELQDAALLISDLEVTDPYELLHVLQIALQANFKSMLLLVKNISDGMMGLVMTERARASMQVVPIKLKSYVQAELAALYQDLALLTGGRPVLQAAGQTLKSVTLADLGRAERIWADLNYFGLSGGQGDSQQLDQHLIELRSAYENLIDYTEKEKQQGRIGKLLGGTGILWIGGATETEIKTRQDMAERTVRALRGAIIEGVLAGGGAALLACQPMLQERLAQSTSAEERAAFQILLKAMEAPVRTLLGNAGYDPSAIVGQLRQAEPGTAFDVRCGRMVDAPTTGILDVAAVQKEAVRRAIGSAALALTIDVLVHVKKPAQSVEP
jgi:chaperonin GroEL